MFKEIHGAEPNSSELKDVLGKETFHSNKLSEENLIACKGEFVPIVDKVFCSKGLPSLFANNQDWWLTAVVVVIELFLDSYDFKDEDDIVIHFDSRKDTTWGALDENTAPYNPNDTAYDLKWDIYKQYHEFLKTQIWQHIDPIIKHRNLTGKVKLYYGQDTKNVDIAVADIVAKLVVKNICKKDKSFVEGLTVETRSCKQINNLNSPENLFENGQIFEAYTTILQEIEARDNKHINMMPKILETLRDNKEIYALIWSTFYDFIKNRISERDLETSQHLVNLFVKEMKKMLPEWGNKLGGLKELSSSDFIILVNEYYSHIGAHKMPFTFKDLEDSNCTCENRAIRRWENNIRFYLRAAQICFNGYDFKTISKEMASLWNKQKQVIKLLGEGNDSHSSSMIGTLGQAYAFLGDDATAEIIFNEGLSTSNSKKEQTYSYLFTIYHKKEM